jgi:hypothetical protein
MRSVIGRSFRGDVLIESGGAIINLRAKVEKE